MRWRARPEDPADPAPLGHEGPTPAPTLIVLFVIAFGSGLFAGAPSVASLVVSEAAPARPRGAVTTRAGSHLLERTAGSTR